MGGFLWRGIAHVRFVETGKYELPLIFTGFDPDSERGRANRGRTAADRVPGRTGTRSSRLIPATLETLVLCAHAHGFAHTTARKDIPAHSGCAHLAQDRELFR